MSMPNTYRSLASAVTGETVEIRAFRLRELEHWSKQVGLRAGDSVCCRANSLHCLVIRTQGGRTLSVDQSWARHIEIE